MHDMEKYLMDLLEKLLKIPSVTGDTQEVITFIKERFFEYPNVSLSTNRKGGLIITLDGNRNDNVVTVSGHVDTLGAMVNSIKSNGNLEITQVGGYDWHSIEGENCVVHGLKDISGTVVLSKGSVHVHGGETSKSSRDQNTIEVRLDEIVSSKDDVQNLGISVGDFVSFDTRTVFTESGYIKSRHLDDKAGVAVMLAVAKEILENNLNLPYKTHFFISNYEEVGHGSSGIPTDTTEILAIDMGVVGGNQQGSEHHVSICAKDSSGPYDLDLRKKLVSICEENQIPYKIDIYPFYGSDATAALRAGHDIKAGLIGPGVANSHGYERTHKDALKASAKLLLEYLTTSK